MIADSKFLVRRSLDKVAPAIAVAAVLGFGPLLKTASAGTIYTSLASFEAALTTYDETDIYSRANLSAVSANTVQTYTSTGPNHFSFTASSPSGIFVNAPSQFGGGGGLTATGTSAGPTATSIATNSPNQLFTLASFNSGVNAIGGYFYSSNDGNAPTSAETVTLNFNGADPLLNDVISVPANTVPFIGYISNSAITSVTALASTSYTGADYIVEGSGAVPEPASLSLLGLGGLGLLRRRRNV